MARDKPVDTQPKFVAIDLAAFDARYRNDQTGAPAYAPAILLRIVLFAYSREDRQQSGHRAGGRRAGDVHRPER